MAFLKRMAGFYALTATAIYIAFASSLRDEVAWGLIASIILGCLMWIGASEQAQPKHSQRPRVQREENPAQAVEEESETSEFDIPEAVTEASLDGATLRQRKLAKIQAAAAQKAEAMAVFAPASDEEELVEVTMEMEDVHTADEFVVEVSAESVEDADIEATVKQRRIQHDVVRERIEKRRRGQLAEIRASTAKLWEDQTAGEDLVALLQTPGHGHSVLVEPENPAAGHIYGATFIRIDDSRILKLRSPLDSGFAQVKKEEEVPTLPVLLDPEGKPLPPLPALGSLPLPMPLPMPAASGALAALKNEMNS